jgi:N-acetylglucosamine-6-phosphate deacetylase
MTQASAKSLLLYNARLVLLELVIERAAVLIEGDRIARIVPVASADSLPADERIDLEGQTVYPGFIDVHIHGAVGVDTLDAEPNDLERVSRFLAT